MHASRLLEIVTALGFDLNRRGDERGELPALRAYYQAVRHGKAKPPGYGYQTVPGETWSMARVLERMGSLGLLTPPAPRGRKNWAHSRAEQTARAKERPAEETPPSPTSDPESR